MKRALKVCQAILSHRGMAIPVLDLSAHLRLAPCTTPAFLLLVSDGERTAAFPLQDLCAVERLAARPVGNKAGAMAGAMGGSAGSPRPVGKLSDVRKWTSISGACEMRVGWY